MATSSTPYPTGFGSLGSQVRAPMPAASFNDLDNNAAPGSAPGPAPGTAPTYATPKARLEAAKIEMTPEERHVIESIQATSFRAQMFGLGVGSALGYILTKRKFPGASWGQLAAPMVAGAFMSPLWSMPLAYFLSKPYMRQLEGDEHLKSVIDQSQQRHIPLKSIPVSAQAGQPADPANAEGAGAAGYGDDAYAAPISSQSGASAAASGPEDAWARLRRQAAPEGAPSSGSAWDNIRKGQQPSYAAPSSTGGDYSSSNGDYNSNVWGDAPTAAPMTADEREFAVDLERERKGQDGLRSTW